jgi:hypothetical protein
MKKRCDKTNAYGTRSTCGRIARVRVVWIDGGTRFPIGSYCREHAAEIITRRVYRLEGEELG